MPFVSHHRTRNCKNLLKCRREKQVLFSRRSVTVLSLFSIMCAE